MLVLVWVMVCDFYLLGEVVWMLVLMYMVIMLVLLVVLLFGGYLMFWVGWCVLFVVLVLFVGFCLLVVWWVVESYLLECCGGSLV